MNILNTEQFEWPEDENSIGWKLSNQTSLARVAAKELGSPAEIQRRNLQHILQWIYRWGFSSRELISDVLGRANKSHAQRLVKNGFLRPASIKGYPTYFVLTEKGLAEALRDAMTLHEYKELDPYRVHLPNLHHDLLVQRQVLLAIQRGSYVNYQSPRMYSYPSDDYLRKIPDAILIRHEDGELSSGELRIALEIELTPKWNNKLDDFVFNVLEDIQAQRTNGCLVVTDSRAILDRYREVFKPGTRIKIWERDNNGKAIDSGKSYVVPEWASKFVTFQKVD
jgi:hypothetical protein